MRNTTLRSLVTDFTTQINKAIEVGIEPLAIAMVLRGMADQCDKLAVEFEKQEKEQQMQLEDSKKEEDSQKE